VSPGLLRLKAHDSHASSEYWRTLRVYLESAMNVTLTAKKLYLNRSTLHQRLKRIEKLLELDLKDPYNRLYILFGIGVIEHNERTGSGLTAARSE
jgi:DNA-binding PucR family transcriptional regulator